MNKTPIPWADLTWNPITGCNGPNGVPCEYCYARGIAKRFGSHIEHEPGLCMNTSTAKPFPFDFSPTVHPHRLAEPLKLKKPSRIFLGSMGDLFDPAFPDEFRDDVFAFVAMAHWHTFVVLTKRAEEMRRYMFDERRDKSGERVTTSGCLRDMTGADQPDRRYRYFPQIERYDLLKRAEDGFEYRWPLPNLVLGVTVTNQADADERIPLLLDTPAAVRWVSVEPMLGPVELLGPAQVRAHADGSAYSAMLPGLDWVVVGGKTPGKPLHERSDCMHYEDYTCAIEAPCPGDPQLDYEVCPGAWLRSLRDQCEAAGVAFFYKHGSTIPELDGVKHDAIPRGVDDV